MIASVNTRNTLSVALIELLRKYHQMKQSDIVYVRRSAVTCSAIIGKNVDHLTKNCGRRYTGSVERIVSGALWGLEGASELQIRVEGVRPGRLQSVDAGSHRGERAGERHLRAVSGPGDPPEAEAPLPSE